eukprot:gene340-474_t
MNTDRVTTSDRRHRLRLGEDLGVRPDADFEILRPQPHILQQGLHFGGLLGAGNEATQTVTQHRCQLFPDRLRPARIYIVKVPYCLRVSEEIRIYEKLIRESSLGNAVCAPGTLKMQVYDGESLKDTDPRAKSYQEYRDYAGVDEGMTGISTRFAFKILSKVFNFDSAEVAANPVHLMYVLEQQIEREQFATDLETKYTGYIKEFLSPRYAEFIGKVIQTAYLESYSEYGQTIFDRYVTYAAYWIQDN